MPRRHFFDVGANTGQTFRWLAQSPAFDGWDVWCFEPSPRHLHGLLGAAEEYGARYRVHVCPFGLVGDEAGVRGFYEKIDALADSFHADMRNDFGHFTPRSAGYQVHAYAHNIARFIRRWTEQGDEVVIKLDCEGAEWSLLMDLLDAPEKARVTRLLIEWHEIPGSSESIRAELIRRIEAADIAHEPWTFLEP